jgi:hypothetical protein
LEASTGFLGHGASTQRRCIGATNAAALLLLRAGQVEVVQES